MTARASLNSLFAMVLIVIGTCSATAQEKVLYSFGQFSDGRNPYSPLTFDAAGNIYGTTYSGGLPGEPYFNTNGTVFELSPSTSGTWTEKVLYNFGTVAGDGSEPIGGVIFDPSGNLYGTTAYGGANSLGNVYELSPAAGGTWTEKVLYNFKGGADGQNPTRMTLIRDAKGNLYGATKFGGTYGSTTTGGTVFELSPATGGTWTKKTLYSFGVTSSDANQPICGLTFDAAGNLYGTTYGGGAYGDGAVYELIPEANGTWTEKVLHSFNQNGVDGAHPFAAVVFDPQGNLYGTTYGGGEAPNFLGTVFELSHSADGEWTEQVLHTFLGNPGSDGDFPTGSLVFDSAGNLYGTASGGGLAGSGAVFKMSPGASGWTEKLLYSFSALYTDAHAPAASLLFDAAGNLYGSAPSGGANSVGQYGAIFEIAGVATASPKFSPAPGAYTTTQTVKITDTTPSSTIYYTINGSATATKYTAPITVSASETIAAFAISPSLPQSETAIAGYQIGTTVATPLFSPPGGTYSVAQSVTLTDADPKAVIYYTTNDTAPTTASTKYTGPIAVTETETIEAIAVATGLTESAVGSAKYTITPVVPPAEAVLYSFGNTATDGKTPASGLVFDASGRLYGTTNAGGTYSKGTAFMLTPTTSGSWTETVIYNFGATSSDASGPSGGLIFDSKGNLYGAAGGGSLGAGSVFELSPGTSGKWTEKVLHNFGSSLMDGEFPEGSLIFDSKGNLYGTTLEGGAYNTTWGTAYGGFGTVFELSPTTSGAWTETTLHSFSYLGQTDGYYPIAGLIFDSKGNLYGTTSDGGSAQDSQGGGTVFRLTPASGGGWTESILYNFGGGSPSGYKPMGGLVMDTAGNLYGTLESGGNGFNLDGTLFKLTPVTSGPWTQTILHSFGAYEEDGINPESTLLIDAKGNLYGTTYGGGANGVGMIFEMTPGAGGSWIEQALYNFGASSTDAAHPTGQMLFNSAGNLFGTSTGGGSHGTATTEGAVFVLKTTATLPKKSQTITFAALPNVTYGVKPITLTATATSGLAVTFKVVSGPATISGTTMTITAAGTVVIEADQAGNTTYNPAPAVQHTFTVAKAPLTVKVNSASRPYGSPNPTLTGTVTGLVNGNTVTTVYSTTATATSPDGTYPITATVSGAEAVNYAITITNGTLTVTAAPVASLSPTSLAFATTKVGTETAAKVVTLKNTGTAAMTLTAGGIKFTGTGATSFIKTATTCGTSLAIGASCTISVAFKPTATGALTASLSIADNAAGSPQLVSLSGTGD